MLPSGVETLFRFLVPHCPTSSARKGVFRWLRLHGNGTWYVPRFSRRVRWERRVLANTTQIFLQGTAEWIIRRSYTNILGTLIPPPPPASSNFVDNLLNQVKLCQQRRRRKLRLVLIKLSLFFKYFYRDVLEFCILCVVCCCTRC